MGSDLSCLVRDSPAPNVPIIWLGTVPHQNLHSTQNSKPEVHALENQ